VTATPGRRRIYLVFRGEYSDKNLLLATTDGFKALAYACYLSRIQPGDVAKCSTLDEVLARIAAKNRLKCEPVDVEVHYEEGVSGELLEALWRFSEIEGAARKMVDEYDPE